jgi:hypothetical protein
MTNFHKPREKIKISKLENGRDLFECKVNLTTFSLIAMITFVKCKTYNVGIVTVQLHVEFMRHPFAEGDNCKLSICQVCWQRQSSI